MLSGLFRKFLKFFWFLPGFLLWAAFPPMGEKTDILFALAPLLWLSRRTDAWTSLKRWFMSGIFFWVATLSWMPAIVKNGGPWPLVALGWFALSAYCAAYFAAFGWLSASYWNWTRMTGKSNYAWRLLGVLVVEPVLWCGLELVRSRFGGGFAWNQLGVVPANGGFGAPAALGGVYLLSAVVILINGTVAGIAERVWRPELSGFPLLKRLGPLETILAFGLVYAVYQIPTVTRIPPVPQDSPTYLKVAMVQRNFPCVFKTQEENPYEVYRQLLTNVVPLQPDLVVLAESAMCEFGPVDQQGAMRFAEWVCGKTGAALLAGGTRYADGATYNSAAIYQIAKGDSNLQPSTSNLQPSLSIYDKVHLVPFGEFIPGDKIIPVLQKLAPVGSCTPGEPKLLTLDLVTNHEPRITNHEPRITNHEPRTLPFGVAICFEDTDSALMRDFAARGARFLCFITNDSWFSHSNEALQHAWQATARAIETGLPVVRVGNSGVTGTIAPDGKTSWLVAASGRPIVDRSGTMFDRFPVVASADGQARTPYVVVGDMPLFFAFLLLILSMVLVKYKAHHEKRRILSL